MFLVILLVTSLLTVNAVAGVSCIEKFKTAGETFKIEERDLRELIKEKISSVDWQKEVEKLKERIKNFLPAESSTLEPATENKTRYVDITYTLPFDIKDADGKVLYPKGYTFNPLDKLPDTLFKLKTYIVFNPENSCEVKKAGELAGELLKKGKVVSFILTGTAPVKKLLEIQKKYRIPSYYLLKPLKERFKLQKTISVVSYTEHNGKRVVKVEEIKCGK